MINMVSIYYRAGSTGHKGEVESNDEPDNNVGKAAQDEATLEPEDEDVATRKDTNREASRAKFGTHQSDGKSCGELIDTTIHRGCKGTLTSNEHRTEVNQNRVKRCKTT